MNGIQVACWSLVASAFVLGGILVAEMGVMQGNQAKANMVIDRNNFSLMTALTSQGAESLFVLDNLHGELLIYNMSLQKKRMELVGSIDLNATFRHQPNNGGGR